MITSRITESEIERAIELKKEGFSADEIANKLDRKKYTIVKYLNFKGFYFKKKPKLSHDMVEKAIEMSNNLCSPAIIGKELGVTPVRMRNILEELGCYTNETKIYWHKDRCEMLEKLILEGKNISEIAEIMGKTKQSILQKCSCLFGTQSTKKIKLILEEERKYNDRNTKK